jgi:hypothetical protein
MPLKRALLLPLTVCLLATSAPAAHATIFTGVCVMSLTISFQPALTAQPRSIDYDLDGRSATDLDPLTSGTQGCAVDTGALSPFKSTSAFGTGHSILATCESFAGTGSWYQSWNPDPGAVDAAHSLSGTWGQWTLVTNTASLNYTGEMELVISPFAASKTAQCASGGVSSVDLIGVMHFQDPEL